MTVQARVEDTSDPIVAEDQLILASPPEFPRRAAQRKLADMLVEKFGFPTDAADLISRAVVNPADTRRQLDAPVQMRVPGGAISVIYTQAWAPFISTYPTNARLAEQRDLPITGKHTTYPPLADPQPETGTAVLRVSVKNKEHLLAVTEQARQQLLDMQPDLKEKVRAQGVLVAPICAAMRIEHEDGRPDTFVLATGDGSTRAAISHDALGVVAEVIVYDSANSDKVLKPLVRRASDLSKKPEADLTEKDIAFARTLVMPVTIIVATTGVDIATAVQSLVGLIHILPPTPWNPGAKSDAYGSGIVRALLNDQLITPRQGEYISGMITFADAPKYGLWVHEDQRAAMILRLVIDNRQTAARGLKSVAQGVQAKRNLMADAATELVVRAYRGTGAGGDIHTARVALQRVFRDGVFWSRPWSVTARTPEELRTAAMTEAAVGGELGPSQIELMVLASYYMTKLRAMMRPERTDPFEPPNLLRAMVRTNEGIALLAQAIRDGRDGVIKLRRVDTSGGLVYDNGGDTIGMSDNWLRDTFDPERNTATTPAPASITPDGELAARRTMFHRTVEDLEDAYKAVTDVKNEKGQSHVKEVGWPRYDADDAIATLEKVKIRLAVHASVWDSFNVTDETDSDTTTEPND